MPSRLHTDSSHQCLPSTLTKLPSAEPKIPLDYDIHGSNTTKDSSPFNRSLKNPQSATSSEEKPISLKSEARQAINQEVIPEKKSLITEYLSVSSFLSRIKAASHNEISKLFTLSTNYNHARALPETQQPILTALCVSFFERALLVKKMASPNKDLFEKMLEVNEFKGTSLYDIFQKPEEANNTQRLYDIFLAEPRTYPLAINSFKKAFLKNFSEKNQRYGNKTDPFKLLDELETTEIIALQPLSVMFKATVRFLILTNEKLIDKICPYIGTPVSEAGQPLRKQVTIFYNKTSNAAFVLYPVDKSFDELKKADEQKNKSKDILSTKPPMGSDPAKGGSLASLDFIGTPVASLNELASIEQIKNTALDSKKISSFTGAASVPTLTNLESGPSKSPISRANILSPKDKENIPSRANQFFTYKEAGVLGEKINSFPDKAALALNIRTNTEENLKKPSLERVASFEGDKRSSISKTKLKNEPTSAKESTGSLIPRPSIKSTFDSSSSAKPVV